MAQQRFIDKSWPLGLNGAGELIPGAAILQERDGKDEPITPIGHMVFDPTKGEGGLWVPVDQSNPLEVRVRQLESKIDELIDRLDQAVPVSVQGSLPPSMMELAVNDWSELPDPTETPKGATAQLIGTFDVRQNTGIEWVEVVL